MRLDRPFTRPFGSRGGVDSDLQTYGDVDGVTVGTLGWSCGGDERIDVMEWRRVEPIAILAQGFKCSRSDSQYPLDLLAKWRLRIWLDIWRNPMGAHSHWDPRVAEEKFMGLKISNKNQE